MSEKAQKTRDQIDSKYKWNIEAMFSDESQIEPILQEVLEEAGSYSDFAGRLTESAATLLSALRQRDAIWQKLEKVYVYARMRRDEDNRKTEYQAMTDRCQTVIAQVSAAMSFFTPELLSASEETLLSYIRQEPGLAQYEFFIRDLLREKAHVLSKEEENILAQMGEITGATNDIFTMLNNADIKFGKITDEDGDEVELTHGNYITFMESHSRQVRKDAYEQMYAPFKSMINTIGATYNYNTKTDVIRLSTATWKSAKDCWALISFICTTFMCRSLNFPNRSFLMKRDWKSCGRALRLSAGNISPV